jgi:acyl dehydratase
MLYFEDFIVGETVPMGSLAVSEGDIVAFASRFDAQDFHVDPEKAKASFVGTLIASGWHSCSLLMRLMAQSFLLNSSGMGAPGVEEVKWLRPVQPGDVLHGRRTVTEIKPSRSRPAMGLVRFKLELLNQRDEPVLEQANWIMFGRRGVAALQPAGDWLAHPPLYVPPASPAPIDPPAKPTPAALRPARGFRLAHGIGLDGDHGHASPPPARRLRARPRAAARPLARLQEPALDAARLRRRPHHLPFRGHRQARQHLAPAMGPVLPPQHRRESERRGGLQLRRLRFRRAQAGLTPPALLSPTSPIAAVTLLRARLSL